MAPHNKNKVKCRPPEKLIGPKGMLAGSLSLSYLPFFPSFPLSSLNIDFVTTAFCLSSGKETRKGRAGGGSEEEDERDTSLGSLLPAVLTERRTDWHFEIQLGGDGG